MDPLQPRECSQYEQAQVGNADLNGKRTNLAQANPQISAERDAQQDRRPDGPRMAGQRKSQQRNCEKPMPPALIAKDVTVNRCIQHGTLRLRFFYEAVSQFSLVSECHLFFRLAFGVDDTRHFAQLTRGLSSHWTP
jgi:hypothetical protein